MQNPGQVLTCKCMFRIVYLSSATELFRKSDLLALLEQSRIKNARLGITGILLYSNGNFIQAIEGEEPVVRNLFKTISQDLRHNGVLDLIDETIGEREFPDWSMGFRDMGAESEIHLPGFNQFLNTPRTADGLAQISSKVRVLLQVFKKNML